MAGGNNFPAGALQQAGGRLEFLRRRNAQFKTELPAVKIQEFATLHAPSPMNATTLPAIGPRFSWNVKMSARIWHGMLVIGQCVDGWNVRKFRKLLHVGLRKGADDRAMNHPAQHPRGVLDRLAAAELDVIGV